MICNFWLTDSFNGLERNLNMFGLFFSKIEKLRGMKPLKMSSSTVLTLKVYCYLKRKSQKSLEKEKLSPLVQIK